MLAKLARSHSVAMARFMNSPGHRRNILYRKANLFGVGTHIKDGVVWVTVNFEQTTPGWR
jgi:uncharacterized protein YkwD